jgi:hypothetical protein
MIPCYRPWHTSPAWDNHTSREREKTITFISHNIRTGSAGEYMKTKRYRRDKRKSHNSGSARGAEKVTKIISLHLHGGFGMMTTSADE